MTKRKPHGYWKKEENVISEALRVMQEQGWATLPSQKELRKHRYHSLNYAIRYHGGIQTIREKLGQQNPTTKPPGYWQNEENVVFEAQQTMDKHGWETLPSARQLVKHGHSSLCKAIGKYYEGIRNFRKKLGQTNIKKPKDYWESLDTTIAEARKIMQEQNWGALPSAKELREHGYSALISAVFNYHGGIQTFRTLLLDIETGKTPKQQLEQLLDEYIAA